MSKSIEARIQRLEDIEAIKQLKARYCAHCDNDYAPDALAELFTEDAIWDGGVFGRHEGREAIREFFRSASSMVDFALHEVMNPIIEVDGDCATGEWYLSCPMTLNPGHALWLAARYNEEYVRLDGRWMFSKLDVHIEFLSPYEKGWASVPMVDLDALQ